MKPAHQDLLDCAELAAKHEQTRMLFGPLFEAAQAQRRVELHMLVHRYDQRTIDIVRTRADEWDRMTVRLIEQEARKLDGAADAIAVVDKQPAHDGWAAVQAQETASIAAKSLQASLMHTQSRSVVQTYDYCRMTCTAHGRVKHLRALPVDERQENGGWSCCACMAEVKQPGNGHAEAANAAK